jgi:hypothetical protein
MLRLNELTPAAELGLLALRFISEITTCWMKGEQGVFPATVYVAAGYD